MRHTINNQSKKIMSERCSSVMRPLRLLTFLLALSLDFCHVSSSSFAPSSSNLVLDRYGNGIQLQNALKAAQVFSLVVVVDRTRIHGNDNNGENGDIWVVSLVQHEDEGTGSLTTTTTATSEGSISHLRSRIQRDLERNDNEENSRPLSRLGQVYRGQTSFLHPLVSSFSHCFEESNTQPANKVGLVFVGVQPDARWLLGQLQEYATMLWERTDSTVSMQTIVSALSTLMRECATSYPSVGGSHGVVLEQLMQKEEQNEESPTWGRPLGVCSLVLNLSHRRQHAKGATLPRIARVDPSGLVQPIHSRLVCLGRHASELEQWWKNYENNQQEGENNSIEHMGDEDVLKILQQGLEHVLGPERVPAFLRIESWSPSRGILERRLVAWKTLQQDSDGDNDDIVEQIVS